jgi:hypothetical protein
LRRFAGREGEGEQEGERERKSPGPGHEAMGLAAHVDVRSFGLPSGGDREVRENIRCRARRTDHTTPPPGRAGGSDEKEQEQPLFGKPPSPSFVSPPRPGPRRPPPSEG